MSKTWELMLDQALDGEANMAVDAELLASVESAEEPRTVLRFYSWIRPTISLGRNQKPEKAVDLNVCREEGIEVVRRPTGGRAVLHDDELTYAVVSNDLSYFADGSIYETYRVISEGLSAGYGSLGVKTLLAPDTRRMGSSRNGSDYPCFVSPSRYELMVDGRKIVGSAQRRLRRSFLQHGSMPITCNRELLARATCLGEAGLLDEEMCSIEECLGVRPALGAMLNAFVGAFQHHFGVDFIRRTSSDHVPGQLR